MEGILAVPFGPEELSARVMALIRRSYIAAMTFTLVLKIGELEIDILKRTVRVGASELQLISLEQSLLYLLAANAGRTVYRLAHPWGLCIVRLHSREEILDTLWGTNYLAESNVVDSQLRNLRERVHGDWREPRFIATVPGRGYRFLHTFTTGAASSRAA